MIFTKGKLIVLAIGVSVILMMCGYIWWQNSKIETLVQNNAKLEHSVEQQKKVVEQKEQDIKDYREAIGRLNETRRELAQSLDELRDKFDKVKPDGTERDIGKLAILKPKLVEKVINAATEEATRCMEIATGAELTEEEKNATKRSEINSECPELANPNYSE